MAKVILIAILSVLAATHSAGTTLMPPTRWTTRPTSLSVVTSAALVPPLVRVTRVATVELPVSATSPLADGDKPTTPHLQPIFRTGSDSPVSEPRGDRVAVLNSSATRVERLRRAHWRSPRRQTFQPRQRPSRGAWVWLSRKQP